MAVHLTSATMVVSLLEFFTGRGVSTWGRHARFGVISFVPVHERIAACFFVSESERAILTFYDDNDANETTTIWVPCRIYTSSSRRDYRSA